VTRFFVLHHMADGAPVAIECATLGEAEALATSLLTAHACVDVTIEVAFA
jgi:hypothetical protein